MRKRLSLGWGAEVLGVALMAGAAAFVHPAFGLAVVGVYLVVWANVSGR